MATTALTYDDPLPLHDLCLGWTSLARLVHVQLQVIKLLLQLGDEFLLSVHCAKVLLSFISFPFVSLGLKMVGRVSSITHSHPKPAIQVSPLISLVKLYLLLGKG